MNSVKSFFNHQLGLSKWDRYDNILKRYVCEENATFDEILPRTSTLYEDSESPIFACKFSQSQGYEHILGLANEAGNIAVVNTKDANFSRFGGLAHNNAIFDLAWLPKSQKLVSASGDHTAALLDVGGQRLVIEHIFVGHTLSLKTVSCRVGDDSSFATGGRDGRIFLWDVRTKCNVLTVTSPELSIPYSHFHVGQFRNGLNRGRNVPVSASNSVTGLIFHDSNTLMSCGAGDGCIKVWDMRKTYYIHNRAPTPKYCLPYAGNTLKNGFSHLVIDYDRNILYANCLDNVIYSYNICTYNPDPVKKYYGHKNRTFYVKMCLSGDGNYILSGSSDNNAYIWGRNNSKHLVRLVGHDAEVTSVAWSSVNNPVLITCSDDLKHKFWKISPKDLTSEELKTQYSGHAEAETTIINEPRIDPEQYSNENIKQLCGSTPYHHCCLEFKDYTNMSCNIGCKSIRSEESRKRRRMLETIDLNMPSTSYTIHSHNDDNSTLATKRPRLNSVSTLLSNLPSFGVDGKAPHINESPMKQPDKDWLTILRLRQPPTSNIRQLSSSPSSNESKSPSRKKSSTSHMESPLLRYFKVTNSPSTSRAKSPNVSLPPSPRSSVDTSI